jgi:hypothetical protein
MADQRGGWGLVELTASEPAVDPQFGAWGFLRVDAEQGEPEPQQGAWGFVSVAAAQYEAQPVAFAVPPAVLYLEAGGLVGVAQETTGGISFAGTIPKQVLAATITRTVPAFGVSFAGTIPLQQLAVSVGVADPGLIVQFAGTIPMQSLAVSLGWVAPPPVLPFLTLDGFAVPIYAEPVAAEARTYGDAAHAHAGTYMTRRRATKVTWTLQTPFLEPTDAGTVRGVLIAPAPRQAAGDLVGVMNAVVRVQEESTMRIGALVYTSFRFSLVEI